MAKSSKKNVVKALVFSVKMSNEDLKKYIEVQEATLASEVEQARSVATTKDLATIQQYEADVKAELEKQIDQWFEANKPAPVDEKPRPALLAKMEARLASNPGTKGLLESESVVVKGASATKAKTVGKVTAEKGAKPAYPKQPTLRTKAEVITAMNQLGFVICRRDQMKQGESPLAAFVTEVSPKGTVKGSVKVESMLDSGKGFKIWPAAEINCIKTADLPNS